MERLPALPQKDLPGLKTEQFPAAGFVVGYDFHQTPLYACSKVHI